MAKPKAYIISGLGIGCHKETAHAYERAGAKAEIIHFRELLTRGKNFLFESQITNAAGGFMHGDHLGAGMCGANELVHATVDDGKRVRDLFAEYAAAGNIFYGQCNGFQLQVKTGLLPGIDGDYSKQTVTLTGNDCGIYRVDHVNHRIEKFSGKPHFAFDLGGIEKLDLWCRHGEGKLLFQSPYGSVSEKRGETVRTRVNRRHVILRYADRETGEPTEQFPDNPNGSVDGIAGLQDQTGNIFGHMAHPEVGIYFSRDPNFFAEKDKLRREGMKAEDMDQIMLEDICLQIFRNIVERFE